MSESDWYRWWMAPFAIVTAPLAIIACLVWIWAGLLASLFSRRLGVRILGPWLED